MVDELGGSLLAQAVGIDVHRGQLGGQQMGIEGIVEGDHGHIPRYGQAQPGAGTLQSGNQHIIADHKGCGPVLPAQQLGKHPDTFLGDGGHFHTVVLHNGQAMEQVGKLVAAAAVGGEQEVIPVAKIPDTAVAQAVEIVGGLPACQQVVIVDADGLTLRLQILTHGDIQHAVLPQIFGHRIVSPGVQQHEAVGSAAPVEQADGGQDLAVILPGDDAANDLPLVTDLADAPDGLQEEGIVIGLPVNGGQHDADGVGSCLGLELGGGGLLVAQPGHGLPNLLPGFRADSRIPVAHTGYGGGGYPCQFGDVFDGYCHTLHFLCIRNAVSANGTKLVSF